MTAKSSTESNRQMQNCTLCQRSKLSKRSLKRGALPTLLSVLVVEPIKTSRLEPMLTKAKIIVDVTILGKVEVVMVVSNLYGRVSLMFWLPLLQVRAERRMQKDFISFVHSNGKVTSKRSHLVLNFSSVGALVVHHCSLLLV